MLPVAMGVVAYAAVALVALRVLLSYKSVVYFLCRVWRWADEWTQAYQYHEIPRFGCDGAENPLFRKATAYVSTLPSLEDADAACLVSSSSRSSSNGGLSLQLGPGHTARDSFLGARLSWTLSDRHEQGLVLRVRRHDRTRVLRPYLQHVEAVADDMEMRRRDLRIFYANAAAATTTTTTGGVWACAPFTHPATLETVAMDPELKARVRADLESFLKGRAYYHRLGRVWRRSYLLYGPAGTGKSTFAAAMARFLNYDVYDIDLFSKTGAAAGDVDLRALLLRTTPRSLILVEDIDRYYLHNTNAPAGALMSFMDGLSSCCGEERVMVFTMRADQGNKDPAPAVLLRPGKLDVHIQFTLCDFEAFKALASNYLGLKDHKLYPQVEESFLAAGARPMSPAELGEIMLANRSSPTRALRNVISKLHHKHHSLPRNPAPAAATHRRNTSWSGGATQNNWDERHHHQVLAAEADEKTAASFRALGKDAAPLREFKKLYGLIKIRSRRESFEGDAHGPPTPPANSDKER